MDASDFQAEYPLLHHLVEMFVRWLFEAYFSIMDRL